jgi:hypothetical protein
MKLAPFNANALIALAVLSLATIFASRIVAKNVSGLPSAKAWVRVSILALATLLAGFFVTLMFTQTNSLIEVGPGQTHIIMAEPNISQDFHMGAPGYVRFGLSTPLAPGDRIQINRAGGLVGSIQVRPDGRWNPYRITEPGVYSFVLTASAVREIMILAD